MVESGIESPLLRGVVYASLAVLSLSMLVAFARVLKGPSLSDRVVAIDFASYVTMGFLGTYAVLSGREAYIDAALVLGLLAFIGTIALARYIEGRSEAEQHASAYRQGEYHAGKHVGGVRVRDAGQPDQQVHGGEHTKRARRRAQASGAQASGAQASEDAGGDDDAGEGDGPTDGVRADRGEAPRDDD
jgi:multicomponent Na+:H+ antiporter subunit F